jgi:Flp pilus assembly pilin Flp
MKHWRKKYIVEYGLIIIGIAIVIVIITSLTGPAVGNIFSNIYANVQTSPIANLPTGPQAAANAPVQVKAALSAPYRVGNMIIKNGEMNLLVADADRAVEQITGVAVDLGGYLISSRMWQADGFKSAQMTMAVPSEQFENAQRRIRSLALQVLNDTASGQDASEEYVDLQARANNLEATAARLREFLKAAKDAEQALAVNNRLTEVEAELEQIKGRMQYLRERTAYSTLTVNVEVQRPTPTPVPTATPVSWQPEKTVEAASNRLSSILRGLGDLIIWLGITIVPFAVPVALVSAGAWHWKRKQKKS